MPVNKPRYGRSRRDRPAVKAAPRPVAAAAATPQPVPAAAPPPPRPAARPHARAALSIKDISYPYISGEIRTIGILTAAVVVILIVLSMAL